MLQEATCVSKIWLRRTAPLTWSYWRSFFQFVVVLFIISFFSAWKNCENRLRFHRVKVNKIKREARPRLRNCPPLCPNVKCACITTTPDRHHKFANRLHSTTVFGYLFIYLKCNSYTKYTNMKIWTNKIPILSFHFSFGEEQQQEPTQFHVVLRAASQQRGCMTCCW